MPFNIIAAAVFSSMPSGTLTRRCAGINRASAKDPVANRDLGDTLADRLDRAGAFQTDHGGQARQGIEAGALVDVDVVQADGRLRDPRLAGTGIADIDLFPFHFLGAAGLVDADGVGHEFPPNGT